MDTYFFGSSSIPTDVQKRYAPDDTVFGDPMTR